MDAAKFIEERKRMCKTFNSEYKCNGCPAFLEPFFCAVGVGSMVDPTAQIAMVEKWSKEHPSNMQKDSSIDAKG